MKKTHNNHIAIAKALVIILMVVGHSGVPDTLHDVIYSFHMPFFFICAGYFFTPQFKLSGFKSFAIRKVKGIYLPFLKWCIPFILLHNVFYSLNLYNGLYGFRGSVSHLFSKKEFVWNLYDNIVCMDSIPQLLGGFWFLKDLFYASLFVSVIVLLLRKDSRLRRITTLLFLFAGSIYLSYFPQRVWFINVSELFLGVFSSMLVFC